MSVSRQDLFSDLFKLKNSGIDISESLKVMETSPGIPKEVVNFIVNNSPQYTFYEDLRKNQRVLFKNILSYESLDFYNKIKTCSSLITRAMISVQYKNLNESLLNELKLDKSAKALEVALQTHNSELIDEVLQSHKNAIVLLYENRKGEI